MTNKKQIKKVIFFGTPEFSAIVLEKMIKVSYKPIAVVTAADKPVGRKQVLTPSPVKVLAEKYKIQVLQPDNIRNLKLEIENLQPELIVLAAYGQIIPKEILEIPKFGCLNVHPSLLPKYRGASPIQAAILNGDRKTGVTIILMDEKIDHGPILAQRELEFPNKSEAQMMTKITYLELTKILAKLGAELLIETLPKWINGEIKPIQQDHKKATYTKIIKKEDGKIDWKKPAKYIERQVRALNPWPGTFTEFRIKKLKITKAEVLEEIDHQKIPGTVFLTEKRELVVACGPTCRTNGKGGKDALILKEVQLEGKRKMAAKEFLNGHQEIVGSVLL